MTEIAGRKIGPEHPPYFIADIGANHDGSLPRAFSLIDQAAEAGADAVKFQNFTAPTIVSKRGFEELGQVGHQASWEKSVYRTYMEATLPLDWTERLAARCALAGVSYLTTPYNLEAVDAIDPYVPAWKIGSGDITYHELIRKVASKGKPILLATGASDESDVDRALRVLEADGHSPCDTQSGSAVCLMHCNSDYSGNADRKGLNLRVLEHWWSHINNGITLGLSDHTPDHLSVCAAVALGTSVIEKHLTDDRTRPGPDHGFAMEPAVWKYMIYAARQTWEMLGSGVKEVMENEQEALIVQRRALRWAYDLDVGKAIHPAIHTVATRPCPEGALEPYRVDELVGRVLKRNVEADTLVRPEDFS